MVSNEQPKHWDIRGDIDRFIENWRRAEQDTEDDSPEDDSAK